MNPFFPSLLLIIAIIAFPIIFLYQEHRETVERLKTRKWFIKLVKISVIFCKTIVVIFIVFFVLVFVWATIGSFQIAHYAKTRNTCVNNIKYIQTAIRNYMQEHDNHLPSQSNWESELMPYIQFFEKEKVFHCPEEKKDVESYIYLGDNDIKIPEDMPLKEIPVIIETKCRHREAAYVGYLDSNLEPIYDEEKRESIMAEFMKKLSHLKETEQQQRP